MAKVSVIVLCYNGEAYITRCLDSLIGQTLEDIEIIVVNDGSTDNSLLIIQSRLAYNERNRQYKIIDFPENHGQAYCRIEGIKAASGQYIIACDADDYMNPIMLELLYNKAIGDEVDVVSCDFYRVIKGESIVDAQPACKTAIESIKQIFLSKKWGGYGMY